MFNKISIIGCGLIGSSILRAIKKKKISKIVHVYDKSKDVISFLKDKKFKNDTLKKIPMGKFAELSDVATAVAFLASDSSKMITGTSILVDGGWTAI